MRGLLVAGFALLAVACGGGTNVIPVTPSPLSPATSASTGASAAIASAAPTPTTRATVVQISVPPSATPQADVPDGFKLVTGDGFRVAVPESWTVVMNPGDSELFKADSPLGGAHLDSFSYSMDGKGLNEFVRSLNLQLEGIWDAKVTRTESTIAGVPAYLSEAYSELVDVHHVRYDFQKPGDKVNVWSLSLDTEGAQPDPAWELIAKSFEFEE